MYPYYILTVSCKCEEDALIRVYNFLNKCLYSKKRIKDVPYNVSDSKFFSLSCMGLNFRPDGRKAFFTNLMNLSEEGFKKFVEQYLKKSINLGKGN